jgi:16S rRNA (guanine(1405)-N(7))-methyltransferase
MNKFNVDIDRIITEILGLKKYRDAHIPESTVRNLIEQEMKNYRLGKDVVQAVRKKLHNIIAPYLGDPDYDGMAKRLEVAIEDNNKISEKQICEEILSSHVSTRERLPYYDLFYASIFGVIGKPTSIIDLACGLNPFSYSWMKLPTDVKLYCYDIHTPRIQLINYYFGLKGISQRAIVQDIVVDPPQIEADVAFIFKEAHRLEQRHRGCNRLLWQSLKVKYLLVSLPPKGMSGKNDLSEKHRRLVYETAAGFPCQIEEISFASEIVYCIKKS